MNGPNPLDYGWWLASRSAGVVALVAVAISVIVGLLMANGLPRRPGIKRRLLAIHESTALAGLVAISVHGLTLLGDKFMHPTLSQIAVPFTIGYRPGFTGLGIIAGWLAVLLGLSFYARRTIGAKTWRKLHRATILVWALGIVHVLGAGTDAGQSWLQAVMVVTGVPIVFLFLRRVMPEKDRKPARVPVRSPAERLAAYEYRRISDLAHHRHETPAPVAEEAVR
jgi:sulfoxide reductase heme-binding subunit YedZ